MRMKCVHPCLAWAPQKWSLLQRLSDVTITEKPILNKPSSCELSNMQTCVPSTASVSEIANCLPSPIADDPSPLPSPTSSLSSNQKLFLPVHLVPALYASCWTVLLYFSRYCTIKLFCVCLFLMYYLCEKYYKPITV